MRRLPDVPEGGDSTHYRAIGSKGRTLIIHVRLSANEDGGADLQTDQF